MHALVVSRDSAQVTRLGRWRDVEVLLPGLLADLAADATALPEALGRQVEESLRRRLSRLSALLVEPLDLGSGRVVLVPPGRLAALPWPLLPGLEGRPVTVARSASAWATRASARPLVSVGLLAGPDVSRAQAETAACARAWGERAERLTGVADCAGAARTAPRVDALHVAAHGRHAEENPLFSGIRLADGTWFGYDVDSLERVPEVVVLSACELGRSTVRWAEELVGMTVAWLHAGVGSVVASPSAISDERRRSPCLGCTRRWPPGCRRPRRWLPWWPSLGSRWCASAQAGERPMRLARRASDWSGPAAAVRSSSISSRRRGTWRLSPPQCAISSMARSR